MITTNRRTLTVLTTSAVLALGLAACGGSDPVESASPTETSSAAETEATETESESAEPTETESETTDGGSGTGDAADFSEHFRSGLDAITTAHYTMEIGVAGSAMTAEGQIDYSTNPPAQHMTMGMPGGAGSFEMIIVDGQSYMNMGEMTGGKWALIDPNMPGMEAATQPQDPLEQMRALENAIVNVTTVGEEDIDGVSTTHYEVTVDTTKMPAQEGIDTAGALPPEITYDIWLDGEGRPSQTVFELESQGMTVGTTMNLFSFGEPVEITAPPADQITEMPGLSG